MYHRLKRISHILLCAQSKSTPTNDVETMPLQAANNSMQQHLRFREPLHDDSVWLQMYMYRYCDCRPLE